MRTKIILRGDARKGKQYARLVGGVDVTKTNGYAFVGDFLHENKEYDFAEGDVLLKVEAMGSWKYCKNVATILKVAGNELQEVESFDYDTEFLSLRDRIAEVLNSKIVEKSASANTHALEAIKEAVNAVNSLNIELTVKEEFITAATKIIESL